MRPAALMLVVCLCVPVFGIAEENTSEEPWVPVPFRIRDLTFPTVLVMGFMPRPAEPLPQGSWAFELNSSVSNNFQASAGVQSYLEQRGGPRRPLEQVDVDAMVHSLEGDEFYIDGEFSLFDVGVHYGLNERLSASLRLSYLSYGGGILDSTIYAFHDTLGIGQAGRDFVASDRFQLVYLSGDEPFVLLDRPTSGGFTDPVLSLAYTFPKAWKGWHFGFEAGVKIPVADEGVLLSTGGVDLGFQLTAQKKWQKNALVVNFAYVVPGDFQPRGTFDPASLPSLNVAYLHRLGRKTTGIVQTLFSDNIFRDETDSALSELEFQISAGVKIEALGGAIGIGFTENLLNFDNTPDFGLHVSYTVLVR